MLQQHKAREANHPHSQRSKAFGKPCLPTPKVKVGSIVYIQADRDKVVSRPRYLVTSVSEGWCKIRRFTTNLIGHEEYDAKLTECYTVPCFDEELVPQLDEDSTDDEQVLKCPKV